MAFEKNLRHAADFLGPLLGRFAKSDVGKTGHLAAIHADKMRVLSLVRIVGVANFKSPNVVAQFRARDQIRLGQVGQIPENRGLIETQRNQFVR